MSHVVNHGYDYFELFDDELYSTRPGYTSEMDGKQNDAKRKLNRYVRGPGYVMRCWYNK